jgi:hypothetical protein
MSGTQKTAKTMKKYSKKNIISDLPTLIFSRYETGTTGIYFFYAICLFGLYDTILASWANRMVKSSPHPNGNTCP